MPRPKTDIEQVRSKILSEAEQLLKETKGQRLVLSEIAARIGISQPYVHRFFKTKADLVKSLARRWFEDIQSEADRVAALNLPAEERLEEWVLTLLRMKRERYDANPELFRAYLDLASQHMSLMAEHTTALDGSLRRILVEMVPEDALDLCTGCVKDATVLFIVPFDIARFPERATEERARTVLRVLKRGLCELSGSPEKLHEARVGLTKE